ncbi:beta-ketoacyl synthase N-terminal-like domain-containing protein, partial [Streptomyces bohaiensis]|uniref:beta-ketoacyl synthase N-terminal-like domain-containing protein n=1 Tax=Streptomyces bohaiensis TaxID=1431344 RepID=UPI003B79A5D1
MAESREDLVAALRASLKENERLGRQVRARSSVPGEPVAIVGMGCRLPGGIGSPDTLWEVLAAGRDTVGGFPTDRGWDLEALFAPDPDSPGTSTVDRGGFLDGAADFDAG